MNLVDYKDYKLFINETIEQMDKSGRGQFQKMAKFCGVHSTLMSQVFKGAKELSLEQAISIAQYFSLSSFEQEYFLNLISLSRAGSTDLRNFYEEKRKRLTEESQDLNRLLPKGQELTEAQRSVFYSSWYYSAVRLACSIENVRSIESLAEFLDLPRAKIQEIVDFLISAGLCVRDGEKIISGPKRTHLSRKSHLVSSHHTNWRLKAVEKYSHYTDDDLSFTGPMTISKTEASKIRKILVESVEKVSHEVEKSSSDDLYCLNIDWFSVRKR